MYFLQVISTNNNTGNFYGMLFKDGGSGEMRFKMDDITRLTNTHCLCQLRTQMLSTGGHYEKKKILQRRPDTSIRS